MDIEKILTEGIVFRGGKSSDGKKKEEKVKTKAKKKTYINRFAWFWLCQDESGISPSESQQTQTGMINKTVFSC